MNISTMPTDSRPVLSRLENGWLPFALFTIAVISRIPFTSHYLYHWDSVNMAFGLQRFDVINGAPHFPGYIVYIALGQFLNAIIGDHQTTLVFISVVSSGLAAAAIYYLGRAIFNPITGLIASIILITSPLVWFYGEIALPHTLDLFAIILVMWLLYRIMEGDTRPLWFTAVFLALLGGFRQQDLLFLGPVALFAVYRTGIRRLIVFTLIGFVVTLAWFIPLIQNTGGLQAYMEGSSAFSAPFFKPTSLLAGAGIAGLRHNVISKLIPYTLYAWSLALVPAFIYWGIMAIQLPRRWRAWLTSRKFWFFLLWLTPCLTFYTIIHMGQQGLIFVYMPALFLLSAEGLHRLFSARPTLLRAATAAIALVGTAIFVIGPEYPLGPSGPRLLTYDTVRASDHLRSSQIELVRANFDPTNSVLLSSDWRYLQYYLPEYPLARLPKAEDYAVPPEITVNLEVLSAAADQADLAENNVWQAVILEPSIQTNNQQLSLETIIGTDGFRIDYLTLRSDDSLTTNGITITVVHQTDDLRLW